MIEISHELKVCEMLTSTAQQLSVTLNCISGFKWQAFGGILINLLCYLITNRNASPAGCVDGSFEIRQAFHEFKKFADALHCGI